MRDQLKSHIAAVIAGLSHLDVDSAADLISEVGDELAEVVNDGEELFAAAILDSLRWGHHAAVTVEMGGGAILRVVEPGGVRITHEWGDAQNAEPQIRAALAAISATRTIATGMGE